MGDSLEVQGLGVCAFTAKGATLVGELRSLQATWCGQKQNKQNPPEQKLHMHITVKYVPYKTFPSQQKCQKENKDESFKVNNKFAFKS